MAKPRIFVSSTFYDLKYIRADLERFIESMGYEAILNERGHIPYGSQEALDKYCYKEIELCDILVGIIGGRYGSQASDGDNSITQSEIETAIKLGKQIYIFIDKNVEAQYRTYLANKENKDIDENKIKYNDVDNIKILSYVEKIRKLTHNNNIQLFDRVEDICTYLQEQWAGLFKEFLQEQSKQNVTNTLEEIKKTSHILKNLVDYLTVTNNETKSQMKEILISNHPAMQDLASKLQLQGKIYFTNLDELVGNMYDLGFRLLNNENYHSVKSKKYYIFNKLSADNIDTTLIDKIIFEADGNLKPVTFNNWKTDYIKTDTSNNYTDSFTYFMNNDRLLEENISSRINRYYDKKDSKWESQNKKKKKSED